MFNRSGSQLHPPSLSPSLPSKNSKKRRRQASDCDELPLANDGKIKPRRIDPDRLAVRLGPELVAEMDVFIVPGAKMPSFEARQALVEKYNGVDKALRVDRRHIYDYFHSRGLRVAKEDKHLNLSHRMSRKPAASRKLAALQVISSGDINASKSSDVLSPSPSKRKPAPFETAVAKSTKIPAKPKMTGPSRTAPGPLQRSVSPLLSLPSMDFSSDTSSSEDDKSPVSSTFDFTDTLTDSSSFDLELVSLGYPVSERLSEVFGLEFPPFSFTRLDLPDDPLFEINELDVDMPQTSPISAHDPLLPVDDLCPLSQGERIEFYNLVNNGIGPARGIEESAGTYKAHMERLYFNRSYPGASRSRRYYDDCFDHPTARTHMVSAVPLRPPTMIEKENINPRSPVPPRPSNNHYYPQTASPSSPSRYRQSYYISVPPRREQPLRPALPASANHFTKLSVSQSVGDLTTDHIATLPPSNPLLDERATPLVWTSPIRYSPSTSQLPTQWQTNTQTSTRMNAFTIPYSYYPYGDPARVISNKAIPPRASSGEAR
ncbi:hypothetical protein C8R44DRAFT_800564 [Mycena epipterygia]|nr:hypothetical protein C8R44DRAFT_800564 [Mycena epipterygia]